MASVKNSIELADYLSPWLKKIIKMSMGENNLVMAKNSTSSKFIFSSNGLQIYDDCGVGADTAFSTQCSKDMVSSVLPSNSH